MSSAPNTQTMASRVASRPWSLRHLLPRRHARQLERTHQDHDHDHDQQLAWRVQDVPTGCRLIQTDFSIAGGHVFHVPQAVSVVTGPPVGLDIHILLGQTPDDFA